MKHVSQVLIAALLLALMGTPEIVEAHTVLKKPFQQRYDFKSVTCFACHLNAKDEDGKRLGKEHLNDYGKAMKKLTAKRQFTDRLDAAKSSASATRKKIQSEVVKEFVETLKQLEKVKSPSGKLWGELIKGGKIDGVKLKKKAQEKAAS